MYQEIENRNALAPWLFSNAMSSALRLYESQANSPEVPSAILPGMAEKVSHIDGPRPSWWMAPSIWYEAVAKPQMKSSDSF